MASKTRTTKKADEAAAALDSFTDLAPAVAVAEAPEAEGESPMAETPGTPPAGDVTFLKIQEETRQHVLHLGSAAGQRAIQNLSDERLQKADAWLRDRRREKGPNVVLTFVTAKFGREWGTSYLRALSRAQQYVRDEKARRAVRSITD